MSMIRNSGSRFSEKIMAETNSMIRTSILSLSILSLSILSVVTTLLIAGATSALAAGSEADFKAAYATAEAANNEAGRLRNQWTTTAAALADAKTAAGRGDFDQAIAASKDAEALAKASIFQATSEQEAWQKLEIR